MQMADSVASRAKLGRKKALGIAGTALVAGAAIVLGARYAAGPGAQGPAMSATAASKLLDRYCVECHNDAEFTANLSLQSPNLETIADHAELWEQVVRKLRAGMMPPPANARPSTADYALLTEWLEEEIDRRAPVNPGTKVLHRLNRTEYANAIRDLLDLEIDPAMFLPADDSSRGFDNIAGSLTISPTLVETYVTAAAKIARMAVGYWKGPTEALYMNRTDSSQVYRLEGLPFGTRGGMAVQHVFPADGEYKFTVRNIDIGAFIPNEQLEFSIDNERVHLWDWDPTQTPDTIGEGFMEVTLPVKAGSHLVGITFVATHYRPSLDVAKHYARKSLENGVIREMTNYPILGALIIQGPFDASRPSDSPSMRKVFTCRPSRELEAAACARQILAPLTRRAFRRPITAGDLEPFLGFYERGRESGSFEDGIELALRRLLASPQFLVRAEIEPANLPAGESYRITDVELASRLAFFLWSTIPDDELIDLASQGALSEPSVLESQVQRMLADPRSESLIENFAQQWLYLRNLATTAPDQTLFPDWDHELREGFARETELLFESIVREDRNVLEMLTADYTFLNERLARHYGIPRIYGSHFRRVLLGPELDYRRGVLGHGSFLSTTWVQNTRTSPVKRGIWVLENILGTPPPEPPPDVPALEDSANAEASGSASLREQMARHTTMEPCASCHKIMDPIGFALENFGADAKWRNMDGGESGTSIDASAELFDGTLVNGPVELREALLNYSPQFVRMLTEKLMTYGLGRGVEYFDMPVIRGIVRDAEQNDYRFSSIVQGIVNSPPFLMRTKTAGSAGESTAGVAGDP